MDDAEAFELIDAHLDRETLTDEQSDALTAWIKGDPKRADEAFYRIFLHSYLRLRLQAGILPDATGLALPDESGFDVPIDSRLAALVEDLRPVHNRKRRLRWIISLFAGTAAICALGAVGWWYAPAIFGFNDQSSSELYAYEGFVYPATALPDPDENHSVAWPTTGGLQGLAGGTGWSNSWEETNSKVAVIVDYSQKGATWEEKDMRKFGPLGYSDPFGNVLKSSGNLMRTATSPRSITTRQLDTSAFPESMRDQLGLGADGSVIWISFLAQSSLSTADRNRYSYVVIGSKSEAGLRIGKLGAAPSGNWTAVGLQTGAEVNLRTSSYPSGEMVFFVARVIFRPGPEDAVIWINPKLKGEPVESEAAMHLPIPDFRFDGIGVHANHSTDFDEFRFGGTFQAVAPIR